MWLDLIVRDIGRTSVIYPDGRPDDVLAFGFAAPVKLERFESLHGGCCPPFIARRLLDEWAIGDAFLTEAQLAAANAGAGVYVLGLHNGMIETPDPELAYRIFAAVTEAFSAQHAGLNMAGFAHELFGWFPEYVADIANMKLRREYPSYEHLLDNVPPNRRSFVLSTNREIVMKHPGNVFLTQMFARYTPPRFKLDPGARRLLRFALEGEGDVSLAEILSVSVATIKKRWLRIYRTLEPVIPFVVGGDGNSRGAEARRHVLRFIRLHPEELHPYCQSGGDLM